MNGYRLSAITMAAMMALYGAHAIASHSVEVGKDDYAISPPSKGKAGEPSLYRGIRDRAALIHKGGPDYYGSYEVQFVNTPGKTGKLNIDGFEGDFDRNVPFSSPTNQKIVGLYVSDEDYKLDSREYPAEFVPAKNITHVFYSSLGICDYDRDRPTSVTLPITKNSGIHSQSDREALENMCFWEPGDFNVTRTERIRSRHFLKAMERMKLANPQLKAMVSIGGKELSAPFHGMVETAEGRAIFVQSVIKFIKDNPMIDGVDLAWEFVGGNYSAGWRMDSVNGERPVYGFAKHGYEAEKKRYTALVKALRTALDQNFTGAQRKTLSAAVSADPAKLAAIDFDALKNDLDFVNVMSYGLSGAWTRYPTHQAGAHAKPIISAYGNKPGQGDEVKDEPHNPILVDGKPIRYRDLWRKTSTEGAIQTIIKNNPSFPREKLVIGATAQSRGWHSVHVLPEQDKFFWHGVAAGEKGQAGVPGTFKNGASDFREIYDTYMTGDAAHLYYDKQAQAAYTWVPKGPQGDYKVAQVESFDDPRSILAKGELVKQYNLGGMFSEHAAADNGLIVNAMNAAVCRKKADGEYYTFSQKYAGEVDTTVVKELGGIAHTVRETLSGPMTFDFDDAAARELCNDPEEEITNPTVTITSTPPQPTNPSGFYATELIAHVEGKSIDPRKLSYQWTVASDYGTQFKGNGARALLKMIRGDFDDKTYVVQVDVSGPGIKGTLIQTHTVILPKKPEPDKPEPPGVHYQDYIPNHPYKAGDIVKGRVDGKLYQCKPFPSSPWCTQEAYEPTGVEKTIDGDKSPWKDAWERYNK